MYISELIVNYVNIPILDQPEGLADASIVYERDEFSGMVIKLDVDLIFRCGSGKDEIDEEYNNRFADGIGSIKIVDTCNDEEIEFEFKLDFSKYKYDSSTTTIGLEEALNLHEWKQNDKNDIEIPDSSVEVAYIRNIPIDYQYYSTEWNSKQDASTLGNFIIDEIHNPGDLYASSYVIHPRATITVNELEQGNLLNSETFASAWDEGMNSVGQANEQYFSSVAGTGYTFQPKPFGASIPLTSVEPQPIFENELEEGFLNITSSGSTVFEMDFLGNNAEIYLTLEHFNEYIVIGRSFSDARLVYINRLQEPNIQLGSLSLTFSGMRVPATGTPTISESFQVDISPGESVWIYWQIQTGDYDLVSNPSYKFKFDRYNMKIDRTLSIVYTTYHNTTTSDLTTNQDLIDYSTEIGCFHGGAIVDYLYPNLTQSIFNTPCYEELYFANGEYMRNKINKKAFKLTPRFFFEELDKVISCGIGVFYDIGGTPTLELQVISEFYSNVIGLTVNSEFDDVVIEIDQSRLYNKIEIGYTEFKDTTEELNGRNEYNIIEQVKGKNVWTKISEFVSSKFKIKRALQLGTEDRELEFDKKVFLLSLRNIDTFFLHSASQSTNPAALGYDDITESSIVQPFGMNRKYSTIFNLVRHKLRWGFGFFTGKTLLENTSLSDKEIIGGSSLFDCGLNGTYLANKSTVYSVVNGNGLYTQIPIFITFNKLMTLSEFLELRKVWYQTVVIIKDSVSYKGNILKADYKSGVVKFKLTGHA